MTRVAESATEAELVELARLVPAGELGRALAAWTTSTTTPDELDRHQHESRSVTWRHEPDGMVTFALRLPPLLAGVLIAILTAWVMRFRARPDASADAFPSLAQQHADGFAALLEHRVGDVRPELVVHVRAEGAALDDGTPLPGSLVEQIAPESFLRALIVDAQGNPVNASSRRRHPSTRQRRVVKARDRVCVDCGRTELLEYDHVPAYEHTGRTITDQLQLRCAPCHRRRHRR